MTYSKAEFFYGASPEIFCLASELRKNITKAEKLVWEKVRKKQILGLRFRRQHPIDKYIVDFYCHPARLVVEIDGDIHLKPVNKELDKIRTKDLINLDLIVIQFTNKQVFENLNEVVNAITSVIVKKVPHLGD